MKGTLELIENSVSKMSKVHKANASYILESYDKAAYMTAAKLGEEVGVSESTVVRFTTELGFEGYPEFQKALQEDLKSKLTSVQRRNLIKRSVRFLAQRKYTSWASGHPRLYPSSCIFT